MKQTKINNYDHKKIEAKWQKKWEKSGIYKALDKSKKSKFYSLIEFPYPSGDGLHVGHIRSNTAMDIISRKRRMEGFNVLYPIGWDAFGLPTENYAIKTGIHPIKITKKNTDIFRKQLKSCGFSFDWYREVNTTDPGYYKWTQWIFLQLLKNGLAYKKKMPINWCLSCKIGLANEEVIDNHCERCGGETDKREKEQWMLSITKYADKLDKDLDLVDYLPNIKLQQRNWIGRSEGAEINFRLVAERFTRSSDLLAEARPDTRKSFSDYPPVTVFTTRADTIFGATYLVLAPDHPTLLDLRDKIKNWDEVVAYATETKKRSELERTVEGKEKTGIELKGIKAINPANQKEIPIFIADYVLFHYGTGAIMAVPAHDRRDKDFAEKFNLPIIPVILKESKKSMSYVMGVDEAAIESIGVEILRKTDDGYFEVEIPYDQLDKYKELIRKNMEPHFWNEFSTRDGFYFIFKHKDGRIEEMFLNEKTNDLIDRYGATFNDKEPGKEPGNVYSWIAENSFYSKLLIHSDQGVLINSGKFNGKLSSDVVNEIVQFVGGQKKTKYKLRDWVFSRQRYWGEPIPVVSCAICGLVPVPEKDLPVKLPNVKNYKPTDTGESPLAMIENWVKVRCPKCKGWAKRETDTMPNWAGSSWYYLRYIDAKNKKVFADKNKLKTWLPVDWYNGGMEHVTLHLLYSRFWHKFLFDQKLVPTKEPYKKRTAHGFVLAPDGQKMSKSKGNVINPDSIVKLLGADTLRVYEMFMGPFADAISWNTDSVAGSRRFIERVWRCIEKISDDKNNKNDELDRLVNNTVKKVSDDYEGMKFNTAVSAMMILVNEFDKAVSIPKSYFETFLILLAPLAPHVTEELWERLGNKKSIHLSAWPKYKLEHKNNSKIKIVIQVNSKVRDTMELTMNISDDKLKSLALQRENVRKWVGSSKIKKIFVVKNRLINIVI